MNKIPLSRLSRFLGVAIIYILTIIWIGNYWLLPGLVIIFDIYISKKVNWTFWKKRKGKNSTFIEWLDALIFAVIAVTLINIFLFQNYRIPTGSMEKTLLIGDHLFVSKIAYGPRMPNTPIAFPFMQNIKIKSWSDLVHWPYKRLYGFGRVKNNDPIVFNFPEGDTVVLEQTATSYYEILRRTARDLRAQNGLPENSTKDESHYIDLARKEVSNKFHIVYRPTDRKDNYVKRCIGIPGDTISIIDATVFINGRKIGENNTQQTSYYLKTDGTPINPKAFARLNISNQDQEKVTEGYYLPLTKDAANTISSFKNVLEVVPDIEGRNQWDNQVFPFNRSYKWNRDNFGPLWIPRKGSTINIDTANICLYERIISVYENNRLRIDGNKVLINNMPVTSYTFKMDYYWMMGDNRHGSSDSRYWGFVPEDHIVGKPKFIWLSLDKEASGLKKIRFNRFFQKAK
jgi:signal peptidase I